MKLVSRARLVQIYVGEKDRWEGVPLWRGIMAEARRQGAAEAAVYRAVEGHGAAFHPQHRHLLASSDLPIMISVIAEPVTIQRFLTAVEVMVKEGLVASSDVDVVRFVRDDDERASGSER